MYIGRNEVVLQMIAQASIGGNGQVYDPHPGNQTGGELNIKQWSSRPWNCVLRPRDPNMGLRLATLQRDACRNQNIGYDWARRTTYFSKLRAANWNPSAIRDKCDTDCSALTCANIAAVGHLMNNSQWASLGQLSTHYMRSALTSRGFLLLTDSRYLTSDKYLLPGDVLLNDGKHTAVNLDAGSLSGSSVIVSSGSSGPTFVPRLTEPSLTDKNWINTGYGGKNRCMVINKSTGTVLPNCFSGDTEIICENGIVPIKTLVGKRTRIPTKNGVWRNADIKYFGQQPLYEVCLGNGSVYKCTANHRWIIYSQSGKTEYIRTTEELKPGMFLNYSFQGCITYEDNIDGLRHGFVYGDGSKYTKNFTQANICGFKHTFMHKYFDGCRSYTQSDGTTVYTRQVKNGKELPDIASDKCYLYNFMRGYFAADGTVDDDGYSTICCSKRDSLKQVRNICAVLGIKTTDVREIWSEGYTGYRPVYELTLKRDSLDVSFFLNPKHQRNFLKRPKKHIVRTTVKSVRPLNIVEDVYCPVEPETHMCTLGNGELTGQCTGYAWGRFMEILGSSPKLSTANAGMWYSYTSDGYERGSTPKLGAVLCMGKPGAAGHVAIVEKINSDGSIVTSESGYSSSKRFWTSTRRPPNYCNSPYYFQGFIYNPGASDMLGADGMGMMGGLLYYVENDEDDAIMREVGYIQPDGKSTLNTTPYKLSVINYTTSLGSFFKGAIGVPGMIGGLDGPGIDVNVSGVDNNVAKQIIQFCMSKGYNLAAACGVCGNVYAECGYNIAAVQKGASNPGLGICQWTYWSRKQAFLREVPDWKTNLTGQLNFMWKEVSTQYTGCHKKMLAVPNNEEGARQATIIWCDEYEAPGVPAKTKRINEAVRLFKSSVIQM